LLRALVPQPRRLHVSSPVPAGRFAAPSHETDRRHAVTENLSGIRRYDSAEWKRCADRSVAAGAVRSTIFRSGGLTESAWSTRRWPADRDAFGALVSRHQRGLVNYIFPPRGSRDVTSDLSQEVFLKVFVSLDSFDPRYDSRRGSTRVASNRRFDHLRRRHPYASLSEPSSSEDSPSAPAIAGSDPSPDDILRGRELEAGSPRRFACADRAIAS